MPTSGLSHEESAQSQSGTAKLLHQLDWSRTALGPYERWPQRLRALVDACFASRAPMLVFVGDDLVQLYNDACIPILFDKHPFIFGTPLLSSWPELSPYVAELLQGAMRENRGAWFENRPFLIDRRGFIEECFFSLSTSPIHDDNDKVIGLFASLQETTEQVLATRRLRTLQRLATRPAGAATPEEACRRVAEALALTPADVPFALLYLLARDDDEVRLAGIAGLSAGTVASPTTIDLAAGDANVAWPLADVARTARPMSIHDLSARFGMLSLPPQSPPVEHALILPAVLPGEARPLGVLIVGVSARLPLDDDYRGYLDLLARNVATAVASARLPSQSREPLKRVGVQVAWARRRREDEELMRESGERHRILSQASEVLAASLDYEATLQSVARLAVPFLADLCFIDLLTGDGRIERVAVHGNPKRQPLLDEIGRFIPTLDDKTHPVVRVLENGESELVPELDSRSFRGGALGAARAHLASQEGQVVAFAEEIHAGSSMTVPLVARGRTLGALTFCFAESGRKHTPRDLDLAEELAHRAAVAVDNARLFADAQRAIRSREELLAVVSHDLRNPLSSILTSTSLLARRAPQEDGARTRKHTEIITRSVERMDRLIGDLLDIASIEAGGLVIEPETNDAAALLHDAIEAHSGAAREKEQRLESSVDASVHLVRCDRERVLQVFANLIGNAIKFAPRATPIALSAQVVGDEVRFCVRDAGPGIAEAEVPHAFDRFYQVRKRARSGVGLGLSIAKGIVEAHGGRIWLESAPEVGSAFWFTLPVADTLHTAAVALDEKTAPRDSARR
jgi:signal transduction histidine kinase